MYIYILYVIPLALYIYIHIYIYIYIHIYLTIDVSIYLSISIYYILYLLPSLYSTLRQVPKGAHRPLFALAIVKRHEVLELVVHCGERRARRQARGAADGQHDAHNLVKHVGS